MRLSFIYGLAVVIGIFPTSSFAAFADNSQVQLLKGSKKIVDINYGNGVLVGSLHNGKISWSDKKVAFSSGTGPYGHTFKMVKIRAGGKEILATPDVLLLVEGNKLKRASKLVSHRDKLVTRENKLIVIDSTSLGDYKGGVHQIAFTPGPTKEMSGHLYLVNGFVVADYSLQLGRR